jgi:CysZ protein
MAAPSSRAPHPARLWDGAAALLAGLRFLVSRRDCWLVAAVPCLCVVLVAIPLCWLAVASLGPWLAAELLPDATRWYAVGARALVRWGASALGAYVGCWFALLVAPALSAPALERLVRVQEAALGLPPRPSRGVLVELWCGLESQAGALVVTLPLAILCWLLGLTVPALAPLLLPLQGMLLALGLAWALLDYPLSLRGMRLRARSRLLLAHPAPILGFGAAFALATLLPGGALVLLPAGVVGATRLVVRLLPEASAGE